MNGGSVIFGTHLLFVTQSEKKNQLSRFWMKESKRSKELEPGTHGRRGLAGTSVEVRWGSMFYPSESDEKIGERTDTPCFD